MKIEILGVKIDNLSLQEVLAKIENFLSGKNKHYIVTVNPEFLVTSEKDKNFKEILNYADIAVADGIGLIYAAKLRNKKIQRVTGVDLVWYISELAEQKNWPVYLLGAGEAVAAKTAAVLKEHFPGLKIVGAESGGEIADPAAINYALINRINFAKPKIIFVAFGAVKQEKWIFYNLDKLSSINLAVGVGGGFDYISGSVKRAPRFLRRLGLEWLFRLINDPKRWQRILNAVVIFPFLILKKGLLARFEKPQNTKDQS